MTNEIKEMNFSEMLFNRDERLLDYITNLQEEICFRGDFAIDLLNRIDKAEEILKDTSVDMPETLLIETIDYARHILRGDK